MGGARAQGILDAGRHLATIAALRALGRQLVERVACGLVPLVAVPEVGKDSR